MIACVYACLGLPGTGLGCAEDAMGSDGQGLCHKLWGQQISQATISRMAWAGTGRKGKSGFVLAVMCRIGGVPVSWAGQREPEVESDVPRLQQAIYWIGGAAARGIFFAANRRS